MPKSVAHLVFRAVVVVLGKVRAADLLQMVVFGEIGRDQEDGGARAPGQQNESDHHKLHRWMDATSCAKCEKPTRPLRGAAKAFCFLIVLPVAALATRLMLKLT